MKDDRYEEMINYRVGERISPYKENEIIDLENVHPSNVLISNKFLDLLICKLI